MRSFNSIHSPSELEGMVRRRRNNRRSNHHLLAQEWYDRTDTRKKIDTSPSAFFLKSSFRTQDRSKLIQERASYESIIPFPNARFRSKVVTKRDFSEIDRFQGEN